MEKIMIQGARIHNLKNINLTIPKRQLVVITGISGSGKSSLAFDILFEEGKNQYLRSIGILAGLDNEDRFDTMEGLRPDGGVTPEYHKAEQSPFYSWHKDRDSKSAGSCLCH